MLRDSRRHISPCQHPTSPNEQILNPHYPCSTDSPRSDVLSQAEQLDRCTTDSDCESMKFCHNTRAGESVCAACRPLRRRCPRNATCCPGTLCINDVCAQPDEGGVTTGLVSPVTRGKSGHHILESKPKKQPNSKGGGGVFKTGAQGDPHGSRTLPTLRLHSWARLSPPKQGRGEPQVPPTRLPAPPRGARRTGQQRRQEAQQEVTALSTGDKPPEGVDS
ncbi:UNVERIFIED_CONTAM: hypothetical protein FKN15_050478 [Acipenser sinensis]